MLAESEAAAAAGGGAATAAEGELEAPASSLPYLALYKSKLSLWARYLLCQWGTARAVSVSECSVMQQEAEALRSQWSWSVPSEAALAAIGRYSPLVELGAGNGHWANLLRRRGADVLAYDTRLWSDAYGGDRAGAAGSSGGESGVVGSGGVGGVVAGEELMGTREADVLEGGPECASSHSDRALMLAWPDYMGRGRYGLECLD